jgi:hypothetical protein
MRSPVLASLLLLAACKTAAPPDVVCPTSAGDPVAYCDLNHAVLIVDATVQEWSGTSHVLDLTGYPDVVFTSVALQVNSAKRGGASGRLDVLMVGCIGSDGTSVQGPLQTSSGKSSGLFFIVPADGYDVVMPQGFFVRDGDLLKNAGIAAAGISEADLDNELVKASADRDCRPPDAGF